MTGVFDYRAQPRELLRSCPAANSVFLYQLSWHHLRYINTLQSPRTFKERLTQIEIGWQVLGLRDPMNSFDDIFCNRADDMQLQSRNHGSHQLQASLHPKTQNLLRVKINYQYMGMSWKPNFCCVWLNYNFAKIVKLNDKMFDGRPGSFDTGIALF